MGTMCEVIECNARLCERGDVNSSLNPVTSWWTIVNLNLRISSILNSKFKAWTPFLRDVGICELAQFKFINLILRVSVNFKIGLSESTRSLHPLSKWYALTSARDLWCTWQRKDESRNILNSVTRTSACRYMGGLIWKVQPALLHRCTGCAKSVILKLRALRDSKSGEGNKDRRENWWTQKLFKTCHCHCRKNNTAEISVATSFMKKCERLRGDWSVSY